MHHVAAGPPRRRRQGDASGPRRGVHRVGDRPDDQPASAAPAARATLPRTPSTPTTGCRAWLATRSSTASGCPSSRPSTPSTASRQRRARRRSRAQSRVGGRGPRRRSSAAQMPCSRRAMSRSTSSSSSTGRTGTGSRSCRSASTTPSSRPATAPTRGGRSASPAKARFLLFVGRIQPLKGADVALERLRPSRPVHSERPARPRRRSERSERRGGARDLARDGRGARSRRAGALRGAAATRAALDVLPGGGLLPRAVAIGVVRARRAGGGRVRHPGRGGRGRGSDDPRPARADRLPRR